MTLPPKIGAAPDIKPFGSTPASTFKLDLTLPTRKEPRPRIVLYAVEGWGKTSLAAHAPSPIILQAREETGVQRLVDAGSIPIVPCPVIESWPNLLAALDSLNGGGAQFQTLVLDSIGTFQRLCVEHVCKTQFDGDFGEHGYSSFGKGAAATDREWATMLQRLDSLNRKGIVVILIGHAKVTTFKNPEGADYDRYECDADQKVWATTKRWADCVWFGRFDDRSSVTDVKKKGKAIGGADRVLYTRHSAARDAKPGYSVPEVMTMPDGAAAAWAYVWDLLQSAKESK